MHSTIEKLLEELNQIKTQHYNAVAKLERFKQNLAIQLLAQKTMSLDTETQQEYDGITWDIDFYKKEFDECKKQILKRVEGISLNV